MTENHDTPAGSSDVPQNATIPSEKGRFEVLRSKRIILPALGVAALTIGGLTWAATADDQVTGSERDRVAAAAVEAAGGGEAVDVETSDDPGEAYEVEVRQADGTEVDVSLDENLGVLTQETDDRDDDDDRDEGPDADDLALTADERRQAEAAAAGAVEGGVVTDLEASDDPGVAYETEVRDADGQEWDVDLDADFGIIAKVRDN